MLRRRPARTMAAGAALAAALLGGPGVGAAAASTSGELLTGTLFGSDGRAVPALLGFDLRDGAGRTLGASGCVRSPSCPVEGYALTRLVNAGLSPAGSTDTDRWRTTWAVRLPAAAERVYVEAYPQGARGTDTRRYGAAYRRNLPVPYGARVNVRLPQVCGAGGAGETGFVNGYASDARGRVALRRISAFSLEPDNNGPTPVLGFAIGRTADNGYYRVGPLASGVAPRAVPGQRYQLIATAEDGRTARAYGVRVPRCDGVRVDLDFGG